LRSNGDATPIGNLTTPEHTSFFAFLFDPFSNLTRLIDGTYRAKFKEKLDIWNVS